MTYRDYIPGMELNLRHLKVLPDTGEVWAYHWNNGAYDAYLLLDIVKYYEYCGRHYRYFRAIFLHSTRENPVCRDETEIDDEQVQHHSWQRLA